MVAGLDVLGATASALQIVGMICSLGNRILDKPKDTKSIRLIATEAKSFIKHLEGWMTSITGNTKDACEELYHQLQSLVHEIDSLNRKKTLEQAKTCLRLYRSEFREQFADALEKFKFRMCFESRRSVGDVGDKLGEMTERMKELRIASRLLETLPGMEEGVERAEGTIRALSKDIEALIGAITKVQSSLSRLESSSGGRAQLEDGIHADGEVTRGVIQQSTKTVVTAVEKVQELHRLNESSIKIGTEILPSSSNLVWNNEAGSSRAFKIWSLDDGTTGNRESQANLGGLELRVISLGSTYDEIHAKRYIADNIEEDIREKKRRRLNDVSPYVGLVRRGNRLDELREFVPLRFEDQFRNALPREAQLEALRVARSLSQEYRYIVLDHILQQKAQTLPKIHLLEDMERAMLALHSRKMETRLGFIIRDYGFPYNLILDFTGDGIQCSVKSFYDLQDGSPLNPEANPLPNAHLESYRVGLRLTRDNVERKVAQLGRQRLCDLIRTFLTIVTQDHHNKSLHVSIAEAVEQVQDILGGVFGERVPSPSQVIHADPRNLYFMLPSDDLILRTIYDNVQYVRVGALAWHQCVLRTNSSTMRYDGPNLFVSPVVSRAFGFVADGNFQRARELLRQAIVATPVGESGLDDLWFALQATYYENGDYDLAIDIFEQAINEQPALFRHNKKFWKSWYEVYKRKGDFGGAVNRLGRALARKEGDCWNQLASAHTEGFKDYASAIAVLESAGNVSGREISAWEWHEIGQTYDTVLHSPHLASKAFQTAVAMRTADSSFFWYSLSHIYYACKRDCEGRLATLKALESASTAPDIWNHDAFSYDIADMYSTDDQTSDLVTRELENQLSLNSQEPIIWDMLIDAYLTRGKVGKAVEMYQLGIKSNTLNAEDFAEWWRLYLGEPLGLEEIE